MAPIPLLAVLMLAIFTLPKVFTLHGLLDFGIVTILFPAIIVPGANAKTAKFSSAYSVLGRLSYPVYVLQSGLTVHMMGLPRHFHLHGVSAAPLLFLEIIIYIYLLHNSPFLRRTSKRMAVKPHAASSARDIVELMAVQHVETNVCAKDGREEANP